MELFSEVLTWCSIKYFFNS